MASTSFMTSRKKITEEERNKIPTSYATMRKQKKTNTTKNLMFLSVFCDTVYIMRTFLFAVESNIGLTSQLAIN